MITGNGDSAIVIQNSGNVVAGNFIGSFYNNGNGFANAGSGIVLQSTSSSFPVQNNVIGGPVAADRNIIGGNTKQGIDITGAWTSKTTIEGNYIGIYSDGISSFGNGANGVLIEGGANANTVGGNIISTNTLAGVEIIGVGTSKNVVEGNYIGTDSTGTKNAYAPFHGLGNLLYGVEITGGASSNTVGGTTTSAETSSA